MEQGSVMRFQPHKNGLGPVVMALLSAAVVTNLIRVNVAWAGLAGAHHSFLGGPWELVVKMGLEGDGLRFPLTVSDESKPQKFDAVLPVMGTPIQVKLEEYVPDLMWETVGVEHPDGGIVAKLAIKGQKLRQEIWLSPADPARQSISSRIGSVAIRRFHNPDTAEVLVRELTHPKAVGFLTIWPEDSNRPFECVARTGEKTAIPGSGYEVTVLEYLPHYSIDTEAKKVVNRSKKPVNPAARVAVSDGRRTLERWLWAKFLSSPHEDEKLPFRMRYTDFNPGDDKSAYILAVASGTKAWLFLSNNKGWRAQKAVPGRFYPFADKEYAFSIERIMDRAIIRTEWKNNSERLLCPAVIATITEGGESQQAVLELNKPLHHKTKSGMLVLLYKRRPVSAGSR
ncbi:MAG: hypothetical protein JSW66_18520 [Phycisphaerales bacterium]|nr:MAG: hypothetical protein JSW66_18520 [Phycisphaerales bacterium]